MFTKVDIEEREVEDMVILRTIHTLEGMVIAILRTIHPLEDMTAAAMEAMICVIIEADQEHIKLTIIHEEEEGKAVVVLSINVVCICMVVVAMESGEEYRGVQVVFLWTYL